jgi:protein-tyrosine phosphatase
MNDDHNFTRNPFFIDRSVPSKLTDRIYLSGFHATSNPTFLESLGITAIINLTPDPNGCEVAGFEVHQISIEDAQELPVRHIGEFIEVMKSFIEEEGQTVLIHCHAGISRTSSFAIAWLMYKRGCHKGTDLRTAWSECEDEVRAVRPIIMPHYLLKRAVIEYFKTRNSY